ncbi:MAG: hypothetical protein WC299_09475, partial [Kiritimatiellia bacterium]
MMQLFDGGRPGLEIKPAARLCRRFIRMQAEMELMPSAERQPGSLLLSHRARMAQRIGGILGNGLLLAVTSFSMLAVLFIFIFIARDAWPFFRSAHVVEFFTSTRWYPSSAEAEFGALAIIFGSALVTLGAVIVAVPLGVVAA